MKNRSGQPDTPHQRLGRHSMAVPSNSSSFYSYDDGDSDEEYWGRIRPPRVGSSRAHLSDSQTSYMSDMARAPHVTDSRNSMLRKYSRAMGSARARGNVSFSSKYYFIDVSLLSAETRETTIHLSLEIALKVFFKSIYLTSQKINK